MKWLTIGDLRKLLAKNCTAPDDQTVPLDLQYGEVHTEDIFARLDTFYMADDDTITCVVSLVDEKEVAE
jgi:hypothetical protein